VSQHVADVRADPVVAQLPGVDGYSHATWILLTPPPSRAADHARFGEAQLPIPKAASDEGQEYFGEWKLGVGSYSASSGICPLTRRYHRRSRSQREWCLA
jgi:hypothetical protein